MTGLCAEDRAYLEASCKASGVPVELTDERLLHDLADSLREGVAQNG